MIIKAHLNYLHIAPRKVRLVTQAIKGMEVQEAKQQLTYLGKKAAQPILKLLKSAEANAYNNFNISQDSPLRISKIFVNQGPTLKRWRPRAFGRAYEIRKKTSHITIELEAKEVKTAQKAAPSQSKSAPATAPSQAKEKASQKTTKPLKTAKESKKFFDQDAPAKQANTAPHKKRLFQRKAF